MSPPLNFRVIPALAACSVLVASPPLFGADADDPDFVEEARQEAGEILNELRAFTIEQKDEALNAAEEGLADLDDNIDAIQEYLNEHGGELSERARGEYERRIRSLRDLRADLQQQYRELATASAEKWEQARAAFADAFRSLHENWEQAMRELRDAR